MIFALLVSANEMQRKSGALIFKKKKIVLRNNLRCLGRIGPDQTDFTNECTNVPLELKTFYHIEYEYYGEATVWLCYIRRPGKTALC